MVGQAEPPWAIGPAAVQVTFRAQLADGTGLESVQFELLNTQRVMFTGTTGNVIANVESATYWLRTTPLPGFQSVADQLITVPDEDYSVTVELAYSPAVQPITVDLIDVFCVVTRNGRPIAGATVTASLPPGNAVANEALASTAAETMITDVHGLAILRLYRGVAFSQGSGIYVIGAMDKGKMIWSYRNTLPDADAMYLPEMLDWNEAQIIDAAAGVPV
jgi:hypothetical protein